MDLRDLVILVVTLEYEDTPEGLPFLVESESFTYKAYIINFRSWRRTQCHLLRYFDCLWGDYFGQCPEGHFTFRWR